MNTKHVRPGEILSHFEGAHLVNVSYDEGFGACYYEHLVLVFDNGRELTIANFHEGAGGSFKVSEAPPLDSSSAENTLDGAF